MQQYDLLLIMRINEHAYKAEEGGVRRVERVSSDDAKSTMLG